MCLAVPGQIQSIAGEEDALLRTGRVDFGGVVKDVSLAYVPEAKVGDYVVVHVGVALNTVEPEEARRTLEYLRQMGELADASAPEAVES